MSMLEHRGAPWWDVAAVRFQLRLRAVLLPVIETEWAQNRVQVFSKEGSLVRIIAIDPPSYRDATLRADDIELSHDAEQRFLFVVAI